MAFQLAELFVSLGTKGEGALFTTLDSIKESLLGVPVSAQLAQTALSKIAEVVSDGVSAFNNQVAAEGRLDHALLATGMAAGFTGKQLRTMASEMEGGTGVTSDHILDAMAALTEFKNVRGEEFMGAINAALDLAADKIGDVESNAVDIGRALENPLHGMLMLSRLGVVLSESERDRIQSLMKQGNLLAAQQLIMDKLYAAHGGAAAANASPFQKLQAQMEGISVAIGSAVAPVFNAMADGLRDILPQGERLREVFQDFGDNFARSMGPAISTLVEWSNVFSDIVALDAGGAGELGATLGARIGGALKEVIPQAVQFSTFCYEGFMLGATVAGELADCLLSVIENLGNMVGATLNGRAGFAGLFETAAAGVKWLRDNWKTVFEIMYLEVLRFGSQAWDVIGNATHNILTSWVALGGGITSVLLGLFDKVKAWANAVGELIKGAFSSAWQYLETLWETKSFSAASDVYMQAVTDSMQKAAGELGKEDSRTLGQRWKEGWDAGGQVMGGYRDLGEQSYTTKGLDAWINELKGKLTDFEPHRKRGRAGKPLVPGDEGYVPGGPDTSVPAAPKYGQVSFSAFDEFAKSIQQNLSGDKDKNAQKTADGVGQIAANTAGLKDAVENVATSTKTAINGLNLGLV